MSPSGERGTAKITGGGRIETYSKIYAKRKDHVFLFFAEGTGSNGQMEGNEKVCEVLKKIEPETHTNTGTGRGKGAPQDGFGDPARSARRRKRSSAPSPFL